MLEETHSERVLNDVEGAMGMVVMMAILLSQFGLQVPRCDLLIIVLIVSDLDGVVRRRVHAIVQGRSFVGHCCSVGRKVLGVL